MSYKTYTSEFKAKVVIEVLQGEKSLSEIAAQYNLNPNMVRNWKSEFLENASTIFENPKKAEKAARTAAGLTSQRFSGSSSGTGRPLRRKQS